MQAALSVLGTATLLLISVAAVLALVILILVEARQVVRLSARLRASLQHLRHDHRRGT
jgi:hypothetical protein